MMQEKKWQQLLFILAGALALLAAAIWNGYPLVYSDTSTYIASGFELETPFDRPITYGLFMRLTSMNGLTLWGVVFCQSLLLSYVAYLSIKHFTHTARPARTNFLILLFLSLSTGVSWMSGQLLTDIFTPISILCIALLLFAKDLSNPTVIFLFIIYTVANAMHISHLSLHITLLIAAFVLHRFKAYRTSYMNRRNALLLAALTLAGIVTMGSAISKSKHVFMMARLCENGILHEFLEDNCSKHNYSLCPYTDSLNIDANEFLWNVQGRSPMYKTLGWAGSKEEYNTIIKDIYTTPKYLGMNVRESLKATGRQLVSFSVADGNGSFLKGKQLYERVELFVPRDLSAFQTSKQAQNLTLEMPVYNALNYITVTISAAGILVMLVMFRKKLKGIIVITIFLLLSVILNSAFTGAVSTVANRYGCKVMWLLPFLFILLLFHLQSSAKTFGK